MKKYLVIGNPVGHSLSPKLHNHWFKQNNIDAVYNKKQLDENDIEGIINEVKNGKIDGINVTIPFKKSVIPFLDKLTPLANETYSVNECKTIIVDAASGVLANDADPDCKDVMKIIMKDLPTMGAFIPKEDGSFTYSADDGFTGTDGFLYHLSSDSTTSNLATVTITVGEANSTPTCVITAPDEDSSHALGADDLIEGSADDVDVPIDWLIVEFSSNLDGSLGTEVLTAAGDVSFPVTTLTSGSHSVTMLVTDEVGATCADAVTFHVSAPPTATILTPTATDPLNEGDTLTLTGAAMGEGYRVGFGDCVGQVLPADLPAEAKG